jgi:hypothetical protein
MKKIFILLSYFLIAFNSCVLDETDVDSQGGFDEVLVIADDAKWESDFKNIIEEKFEAPYEVLPQPEKTINVTHVEFEKFDKIFKRYRNILVIADLEDTAAVTKLVTQNMGEEQIAKAFNNPDFYLGKKTDLWANNQLVVFLFAPGVAKIDSILKHKSEFIKNIFLQNEIRRYHEAVMSVKANKPIMKTIADKFGFSMDIPSDYFIAKNEAGFLWLRKETEEISFNLLFYQEPLSDNGNDAERGVELRNILGKKHVSSQIPGSYMNCHLRNKGAMAIGKRFYGRTVCYLLL